jgi:DNA-binding CsgD family transcriptional regulator
MIRNGMSSKEIAAALDSSEETVRSRRKIIRKKLGISGKTDDLAGYLKSL